ncbi:NAD(P)H-binding protein [Streptomyces sp. NPDC002564]|uniref:NmrA family NAD(P)-binding protein n=1 Tax=Streptomyces sp. NPDC002564 TaxID=3364649 RepID=UPI00368F343F
MSGGEARPAGDGTILVTGGTGTTGRRVAARLAARGHRVRVASRRPGGDAPHGAAVRFDWADTATHAPALDGVSGVYLVPAVADPDPAAHVLPFLDRARRAGVERVVLLGASAVTEADGGLGEAYRALRERFPAWAVLRPSWFMQNFTGRHPHAESIRASGEIVSATGDGRIAFVDADDIAEVGVRALTDGRAHNAAHLVTGPQALSYADAAALLSGATGRPVRHRAVSRTVLRDRLTATGMPVEYAEMLAGMDEAIAAGAEDRTSPAVERVTGRAPRSFAEFVAAHAGDRRPGADGAADRDATDG